MVVVETREVLATSDIVEVDNLDARVLQDPHEGCVFSCEAFPVRNGAEEETARELGRRDAREPREQVCRGGIMDQHTTTRRSFVLAVDNTWHTLTRVANTHTRPAARFGG